jgi:hypothetical protein
MQPAAALVGPSSEPSVRKISVRFSSGATICIEKTIKVQFFRLSPRQTTRTVRMVIARNAPTNDAIGFHAEKPVKTA